MKIKTTEALGWQLDWVTALIEHPAWKESGYLDTDPQNIEDDEGAPYSPSTDWAQAGPIIERENINLVWSEGYPIRATIYKGGNVWIDAAGSNPLAAAMRCYVASKFGDEFEVPDAR